MYNFMKKGTMMFLVAGLLVSMTGCGDDDPNYDNVTPPTVAVAPNTLAGVITNIQGEAIAKATITLGTETATTDEQGAFLFSNVKAGTYSITAEAEGKLPKVGEIVVEDSKKSQNLVWNASLVSDVKKEVVVSATETTSGDVITEALKDNTLAEVEVDATVPAGAIDVAAGSDDVKLIISPIYKEGDVSVSTKAATRANEESILLLGASISCNKAELKLNKPVDLGFNVSDEVAQVVEARQYKDGRWVAVDSRIEDGKIIIEANEFTAYGLFLGVSFSASNGSEAISFEQDKWDNLYGAKDMVVSDVNYTYKSGTEIAVRGTDRLTALLIEKLAQRFGATVTTLNGTYPMDVTLPIGTILTISGSQSKQNVSASAMGKSASGVHYGTVSVAVVTSNRQHTGGTNG